MQQPVLEGRLDESLSVLFFPLCLSITVLIKPLTLVTSITLIGKLKLFETGSAVSWVALSCVA